MPTEPKTTRLSMRIGDGERKMLDELGDAEGLPVSDVVRLLIRRAHAERFGEARPLARKPKR